MKSEVPVVGRTADAHTMERWNEKGRSHTPVRPWASTAVAGNVIGVTGDRMTDSRMRRKTCIRVYDAEERKRGCGWVHNKPVTTCDCGMYLRFVRPEYTWTMICVI